MSIAAAENAGLGPCELPLSDQWLVHSQLTSSQQSQSSQSQSQYSSSSQTAATQQQQHSSSGGSSASHQHLQPKIMNAVVPAVSVPAASKKIRRKPDTKPQSQINKCNNEKRRRELENEYIEQLGEFLQINKRDMTACKPDKAAILSEVVRTFRRLLEQGNRDLTTATGNRCSKCSPDCSDSCKLHPVQQGEVSSTEPPLPEPSVNGHSPEKSAYFEAVQYYISNIGWALLEINSDGVIECATENVRDVLHYSRNELHGQSIYSYLHTGDHSKLSPILNKNSFELNWDQDEMFCQSPKRTIRTKIRWLLRAPDSANDTIEQKQQRQEKYKDLLIISAQVKDDTDAESSSVLCLITLPEDELNQQQHGQLGQLGLPGSVGVGAGAGVGVAAAIELSSLTMPQTLDEQLTLKLDMNGAIIDLDAATLRKQFAGYLTKEAFRSIHDLCHFQDRARLNEHLNNVMNANGTAQVSSYRLRLGGPDVYVHVKAQTRLFRNSKANNEPDFIMAIHTILTDSEVAMVEAAGGLNNPSSSSSSGLAIPSTSTGGGGSSSGGSGNSSSSRQLQQITQGVSNMGGPLMSSIINGGAGGNGGPAGGLPGALSSVVSPRSNPTASLIPPSDSSNFFNSDFEFEFPHSTFDMESVGVGWDSRPDSRTSVTPVSTPRPPSVTAYSPAAAPMCPSPLTPYHAGSAGGQPSPSNNNQQVNNNNNNNSMTNNNAGPFGSNFPFPFDDKEKIQEQIHQQQQQQNQQQQQQQQMASHDSERLRNLLTTKRPHSNASSSSGLDMDHDHRNPNRILKLLNEKSDDDDLEGRNRPSELLRQLQKVKDEPKEHPAPLNNEELIQMLRFQGNDRKRPSNEPDEGGAAKRPSDKPSKLCEKNKMLASLLANPAKAPTPLLPGHLPLNRIIPDIPISNVARQMASVTSSTPPNQQQQTINNNNLTTSNNNLKQVQQMNHQLRLQQQQQQQHQQQLRKAQAMPSQSQQPPTSSDIYLSQHQQQQAQQAQVQAQQQALLQAHLVAAAQQRQQNFSPAIQDSGIGSVGSGTFATPSSATSTTSTPMPEWDSELNEILNHVIDIAPEGNFVDSELNSLLGISSIESSTSATPSQSSQQDIQEKLAINAIQKSLMQIENVTSPMQYSGSPPAYPMHGGGMSAPGGSPAGGSQQAPTTPNPNFTPPPVYTPRVRMSSTGSSGGGGGGSGGGPSGGQMGNGAPGGGPNALTIQKLQNHQQQRERIHQEQQRQRLLQQQKQQQMVVPVNATANADMNRMQNIESLLNNTVAPNVSLTRANSVVPDSQLSPGFSPSQLMQQQLSPNQRTQLSPQQTGFQGSPFNNNPVHRMSPQQVGGFPQQQQQQPGTPGSQQLSPRQPPFASNPQVSQPNALQQQQQQWQNANARLSIQQQNPMLNAQLSTIPGYNPAAAAAGRQQFVAPQRQRSLNSPGTPRQGSFGGTVDGGGFPGPPSPSQPGQNFNNPAVFAAAQQMRLQRQGSVPPQATQHLPGSPRPSYGGHGPGPDASGYGMMFSQAAMQQHTAGSPGDYFNRVQTGGANGGGGGGGGGGGSNGGPNAGGLNSSELVRQELRAVVSGRAQNAAAAGGVCGTGGLRTPQSPIGMSPGMVATAPGGPGGGGNVQGPGSASSGGGGGSGIGGNGDSMQTSQLPGTSSSSSLLHPAGDMDPSMLFNFHLTPKELMAGGTLLDSSKLLAASDDSWPADENVNPVVVKRSSSEAIRVGDPKNSSLLLQKLLSD
ncbi:nuclear receptor coactivator 1 isoform X3 [Culex quinquefasciatus]|uniref:nuclear receptor coactivator 1 isoform X3 n=1 Tax=Culex quinquefasciatus TaxID=7176 RepID=UPI0018E3AEA5|nr:nuclear receptor coactivator 1 isoform X3 [Culex quinquefasciatus]